MPKPVFRNQAIFVFIGTMIGYAELNGFTNGPFFKYSAALFWVVDALFNLGIPLAAVWLLKTRIHISSHEYGLRYPVKSVWELLGASLFFVPLLFLAWFLPQRIFGAALGDFTPAFSYGQAVPKGMLHLPAVLYLSITAGLVESMVYIGLPWLLWREHFGKRVRKPLFCCCSAIVFASVHWEQGSVGMLGVFFFGLIACLIYLKTTDHWPVVGAHVVIDVIAYW